MGTDAWFYGSVLFMLCYSVLPGNPGDVLERIWTEMKAWYSFHRVVDHFGKLKMSMFHDPAEPHAKFPKLKGRAIEMRNLGKPLLECWMKHSDPANMQHKQIGLALKASCAIEDVLTANKGLPKLPTAAGEEIRKAGTVFLLMATALNNHFAVSRGEKLFNITVKFHYLDHACDNAKGGLNPTLGWCYAGEDYMSKLKRLAASCMRGTGAQLISTKLMQKYSVGLHKRLVER